MLLAGLLVAGLFSAATAQAQIQRDPNGVNVNSQGATSVFITFGNLDDQVPVEAFWCGELIPAAPDRGFRCDPSTLFGRLPLRFDRSRLAAGGASFTDIMTIPPSVSRRAYQAAQRGETSSFFYVRRFTSLTGGPDEYVFVTCRLAGGGARTPLSLVDVQMRYVDRETVATVAPDGAPPSFAAEIRYTGTGRLIGRWEVVRPSDDPPSSDDLLTEATLPPALRGTQRRYSEIGRFNVYLPPTGRLVLDGPPVDRLPTEIEGLYQVLLRIEASEDKEANSSLGNAGAGNGVIHAGAVAGFPLPTLRYFVGAGAGTELTTAGFHALVPRDGAVLDRTQATFSWDALRGARLYRLEVVTVDSEETVIEAVVQQGITLYRAPPFAFDDAPSEDLRWRVVAVGPGGEALASTPWRRLSTEVEPTGGGL